MKPPRRAKLTDSELVQLRRITAPKPLDVRRRRAPRRDRRRLFS